MGSQIGPWVKRSQDGSLRGLVWAPSSQEDQRLSGSCLPWLSRSPWLLPNTRLEQCGLGASGTV